MIGKIMKKVLLFSAPWCDDCVLYKETLKQIDFEYEEIIVADANYVITLDERVTKYDLDMIPTLLMVADSGVKEYKRLKGSRHTVEQVKEWLNVKDD
jgi:glutaredoxin